MCKLNIRLDGCGGRGGGGVGDKPFERKRKARALNLPETLFRREVTLCKIDEDAHCIQNIGVQTQKSKLQSGLGFVRSEWS